MCIAITTKKHKCKLSPNDKYCKLHKKLKDNEYKSIEVKNLNKTMNRKNNLIKELRFCLDEKNDEISNLKDEIEAMKRDFEDYQFIKMFETIKRKLKILIGKKFKDIEFLNWYLDYDNNKEILETVFAQSNKHEFLTFSSHFDKLRLKRNKLSHTSN